ncbi:MAG: M2 family metallopeptidase [Deltaproteobacteria bacterium]|nr:M2 family metallopeptidase [Deltaproteobacteria bacterium]
MNKLALATLILAAACSKKSQENKDPGSTPPPKDPGSAQQPAPGSAQGSGSGGGSEAAVDPKLIEEAKKFVADTDGELRRVLVAGARAEWANQTDLTDEHEKAAAAATAAVNDTIAKLIKQARKYEPILGKLDPSTKRQLEALLYIVTVATPVAPSPDDPKQSAELATLAAEMTSAYGKGKVCTPPDAKDPKQCKDLDGVSKVLQKTRKPDEALAAWKGWHDKVGGAERDLFAKYVPLANAGAKAIGFPNVAVMWQSGYDMPAEAFAAETDRLWNQMKPLYDQLHCYTRRKLNTLYGDAVVAKQGPIPAHLLGNMWAQSWGYLYPELEPYKGEARIDVTPVLEKSYDEKKMVELGEAFYTSLGFEKLPKTFWERSMFSKPPGKEVVCHASAWDVEYNDDLRIKMCVQKTTEDLRTIHHELGHHYYFHAYYKLPVVLQAGANDGFHEAIGDTIALSMTPEYLKTKGLVATVTQNEKATINQQMRTALDKIAFLPFAVLMDRWRWDVFAGTVAPDKYNEHWWALRKKYQGVGEPVARAATDFDPGAKYHIASNTPYMRYFLAAVLQFQFHRALCKKAGHTGPLHACSIYDNTDAGKALWSMLQLGASKPWQEALFELTGQKEMDASAVLDYFAPLKTWLEGENKNQACGF